MLFIFVMGLLAVNYCIKFYLTTKHLTLDVLFYGCSYGCCSQIPLTRIVYVQHTVDTFDDWQSILYTCYNIVMQKM